MASGRKKAVWDRSIKARERLGLSFKSMYKGRHFIAMDTRIDKGVSVGGFSREAIVVDFDKSPSLQRLYNEILLRCRVSGKFARNLFLGKLYGLVDETFQQRSDEYVEQLVNSLNVPDDYKVSLDFFVENHAGVCRHMALTAGVVTERLADNRYLRGKVSVDRNEVKGHGAHEWVRYTSSSGRVLIIDVARGFCGTLEDSAKLANSWPYQRKGDLV